MAEPTLKCICLFSQIFQCDPQVSKLEDVPYHHLRQRYFLWETKVHMVDRGSFEASIWNEPFCQNNMLPH